MSVIVDRVLAAERGAQLFGASDPEVEAGFFFEVGPSNPGKLAAVVEVVGQGLEIKTIRFESRKTFSDPCSLERTLTSCGRFGLVSYLGTLGHFSFP